jgi:hypothetical protein
MPSLGRGLEGIEVGTNGRQDAKKPAKVRDLGGLSCWLLSGLGVGRVFSFSRGKQPRPFAELTRSGSFFTSAETLPRTTGTFTFYTDHRGASPHGDR